jgi:hypothetical protein
VAAMMVVKRQEMTRLSIFRKSEVVCPPRGWRIMAVSVAVFTSVLCVANEVPTGPRQETRLPVPDAATIDAAQDVIAEAYSQELREAKDHPQELANKLAAAASATVDPARRYALMRQAEQLAVSAGDHGLAMRLVIDRGQAYQIDTMAELLVTLKRLAARQSEESARVLPVALGLAQDAAAADRFDLALAAVGLAKHIGQTIDRRERMAASERRRTSRGTARPEQRRAPHMLEEVGRVHGAVIARQKAYEMFVEAKSLLESDPDSEVGNQGVGMYLCFYADEWTRGLSSLVRARDGEISAAAAAEIAAGDAAVQEADVAFQIAGLWWRASEANSVAPQYVESIRDHAARLYGVAAGRLTDPLDRAIAEKRSQEGRRAALPPTLRDGRHETRKATAR